MPSANPKGRPRGQTSLAASCRDFELFIIRHIRWENFCFELSSPPYTKAAAARKAGYSPKSARFIASRLWKKPVIRDIRRRINERVNGARKISESPRESVWLIPDYSGKYQVYHHKKIR